jgi:pyruvate formate lyase activating enzyme
MTEVPGSATVFDVQRFSIHDGPGIRTVVFFKGCALACEWCQNPEAMSSGPEIAYYEDRCIEGCTRCLAVCEDEALRPEREGRVDFARCTHCGACVEHCPSHALRLIGRRWSARELLSEVGKDRSFFDSSGGGLTLSGGEPVLQSAFLTEFLPLAKQEGLHIALETAGAYAFAHMEPLIPWVDLWLFDLKVVDARRHSHYTGRENGEILANLEHILRLGSCVEVRMPVVPDRNTDAENVARTARLLGELGVPSLQLLPYNHLWEAKLPRLASKGPALGLRPPRDDFYRELSAEFARHGLEARL